MEIRDAIDAASAKKFDTAELRKNFLVQGLFQPDKLNFTYTFYDRIITGGVSPVKDAVELRVDEKIIGTKNFLDRREMGIINIGGSGIVFCDTGEYELDFMDCLYLGLGTKGIKFRSLDSGNPAKFYILSAPAHMVYSGRKMSVNEAVPADMGSDENSNRRTIYKYIHAGGIQSCQLVMGLTKLAPNNVWNTMPPHTHPRRVEVYLYFDISENNLVFHYMGEPSETRHLIVRNEEAVLSPSWSIHSGAGTGNYTFIWGMAGENQDFGDMDGININDLK